MRVTGPAVRGAGPAMVATTRVLRHLRRTCSVRLGREISIGETSPHCQLGNRLAPRIRGPALSGPGLSRPPSAPTTAERQE
jgi:hypothetical protein